MKLSDKLKTKGATIPPKPEPRPPEIKTQVCLACQKTFDPEPSYPSELCLACDVPF